MSGLTWGTEVVVVDDAPPEYRPGSRAWVVGLRTDETGLVMIEFDDGTSVELPGALVQERTPLDDAD